MMVVDLRDVRRGAHRQGRPVDARRGGITLNKNTVPDDRAARSSRAACASARHRDDAGMTEAEMGTIAELIARACVSATTARSCRPCARRCRAVRPLPRLPQATRTSPAEFAIGRLTPADTPQLLQTSDCRETLRWKVPLPPVGSALVPGTGDYLIIGAVAALVTFAATPLVGRLARTRRWLYYPDRADRAHQADAGDRRAGGVRRVHRRVRRRPPARPLRLGVRPQLRAAASSPPRDHPRRRAVRRHPERGATGEGDGDRPRRPRPRAVRRHDVLLPASRSSTTSCCRRSGHPSSPCSGCSG